MADPGRGSMATMLLRAMVTDGVDISDEAAVQRWTTTFNNRPDDERFLRTGGSRFGGPPAGGPPAGGQRTGGARSAGARFDQRDEDADSELPISMPPVRLAPKDVLAAAVRSAPTWRQLAALVDWVGTERRVTDTGVLPPALAVQVARLLGIPAGEPVDRSARRTAAIQLTLIPDDHTSDDQTLEIQGLENYTSDGYVRPRVRSAWDLPELIRLWTRAVESDLLQVHGRAVYPGTRPADAPDRELLETWGQVLDITVTLGVDVGAELRYQSIQADRVDHDLPLTLIGLYTVGEPLPVAELVDASWEGLAEDMPQILGRPQIEDYSRLVLTAVYWDMLARLAALGAVRLDDETVELTPLGVWGVNRQLRLAGMSAPQIGELSAADAHTMLQGALTWDPGAAELEVAEWVSARAPDEAAAQIADAARLADSAGLRLMAFAAFDQVAVEIVEPYVRGLLDDAATEGHARTWLATHDLEPLEMSTQLAGRMLLEIGAAMLEAEAPEEFVEHLASLGSANEQVEVVRELWRADHPAGVEVLESVGHLHPDKKVAKAARKAAFQARSRRARPANA